MFGRVIVVLVPFANVTTKACGMLSHRWPSDDFLILILVHVDSIYQWQRRLEELVEICRPLLEDRVGFFMAPVRDDKIVGSFAIKVFEHAFPAEEVRDWPELPSPLLDERVTAECGRGLAALVEVSGVVASVHGSELHDDEAAVVEVAMKHANGTLRFFKDLVVETEDALLVEIGGTLLELAHRVEEEAAALASGAPGRVASPRMSSPGSKVNTTKSPPPTLARSRGASSTTSIPAAPGGRFHEALAA